jgi:hypothetical protein
MFMIYLCTKFHMSSCSGSIVDGIKLEPKVKKQFWWTLSTVLMDIHLMHIEGLEWSATFNVTVYNIIYTLCI